MEPPGQSLIDLHRAVQSLRAEQRYIEAEQLLAQGLARYPDDPSLLMDRAQTRYELGLPAAQFFAEAQQAMPGNMDVIRNRALAMASEGDKAGAEHLLRDALKSRPGWLDGHKCLATLLWTSGDAEHFAASYAGACRAEPGNAALWIAWFSTIAQTRDWTASRRIIDEAERQIGTTASVLSARLFIASESGDDPATETLLAACAHIRGDTINLCRIRHQIRQQRFDEARDILLPLTSTPAAGLYWPYLSLVWRALEDERHLWLDRPDLFIQQSEIGLSASELSELTEVLNALHIMERPYIEQTVRGGTQTDRSIMLRHEPILGRTRERWIEAIRDHIAALPGHEADHPFLGTPRNQLLIGGSWSVHLRPQGHNVPHTHPMGWMSSSLYVAVPGEAERGPSPAAHIAFGTPPTELGLNLPAYRTIAPKPGMLVTFPSTMWHSVAPFARGERLMIALDLRLPGN
jgi:Putative 2OG-Fe(II) oxygenase